MSSVQHCNSISQGSIFKHDFENFKGILFELNFNQGLGWSDILSMLYSDGMYLHAKATEYFKAMKPSKKKTRSPYEQLANKIRR